ncbi:MAG: hypothetical protein V1791_07765 [Pseudomonadota bacterium]
MAFLSVLCGLRGEIFWLRLEAALWNPIRNHIHNHIGLRRVICHEMYREIVRAIHAGVHRKNARLDSGAFTGLNDHRTDG